MHSEGSLRLSVSRLLVRMDSPWQAGLVTRSYDQTSLPWNTKRAFCRPPSQLAPPHTNLTCLGIWVGSRVMSISSYRQTPCRIEPATRSSSLPRRIDEMPLTCETWARRTKFRPPQTSSRRKAKPLGSGDSRLTVDSLPRCTVHIWPFVRKVMARTTAERSLGGLIRLWRPKPLRGSLPPDRTTGRRYRNWMEVEPICAKLYTQ